MQFGHIKGFVVVVPESAVAELGNNSPPLVDAPTNEPSFWLKSPDGWLRQPATFEVRIDESLNEVRYLVRYGKLRDRDEYNRAHFMVAGTAPCTGSSAEAGSASLSSLIEDRESALASLDAYDERAKLEVRTKPWYQRLFDFLGSDPDWQRLALGWTVVLVTFPDDLEVGFDMDRATVPGVFNYLSKV